MSTLQDVVELIRKSKKIIVLTGAGVSVSCGIPDFRSRDGVYARLAVDFPDLPDPQAMFDIHYFRKDPRPFFKFAREIYPGQFNPSPCHKFIRCVEKQNKLLRNYTQNIDTLEQVVGIQNVVQCHGSFATATCMKCKHKVKADVIREDIFAQKIPKCPMCGLKASETENQSSSIQQPMSSVPNQLNSNPLNQDSLEVPAIMKPDIVFFGEGLGDEFHDAVAKDKDEADLLIMIGSSLKVRPVALIPSSINPDVPQILINREPLPHLKPDVELLGDCDGIINQICHMLGQGWEDPIHSEPLVECSELSPVETPSKVEEKKVESDSTSAASTSEAKPDPADPVAKRNEELAKMWEPKTRPTLAQRLKPNEFLFVSPNRYVFPGAEVFDRDDDDESEISSNNSDSDTDSDDEADSSDSENHKKNNPEAATAAEAGSQPEEASTTLKETTETKPI